MINHLAYADDLVIFSSRGTKSIKLVMKQIKKYELSSGQNMNNEESFFLTAPKASATRINRMRNSSRFMDKKFPFTYLGCPIYVRRKKIEYFDIMVSKVIIRLGGWQGKILSYGGKKVLIKHVLQALPTYTLAGLNPPKAIFKLLERHFANFFWGVHQRQKKYHWNSWRNLCYPEPEGGIGIRSMEEQSMILATKRWWRFRYIPSLWATFLKNKYCISTTKKWASGNSHQWKMMTEVRS